MELYFSKIKEGGKDVKTALHLNHPTVEDTLDCYVCINMQVRRNFPESVKEYSGQGMGTVTFNGTRGSDDTLYLGTRERNLKIKFTHTEEGLSFHNNQYPEINLRYMTGENLTGYVFYNKKTNQYAVCTKFSIYGDYYPQYGVKEEDWVIIAIVASTYTITDPSIAKPFNDSLVFNISVGISYDADKQGCMIYADDKYCYLKIGPNGYNTPINIFEHRAGSEVLFYPENIQKEVATLQELNSSTRNLFISR